MDWSDDASPADWWIKALAPFAAHRVCSLVPAGFETVTRLFHPISDRANRNYTWRELAEMNGRTPHGDMQLHAIATPARQRPEWTNTRGFSARTGELPESESAMLAQVLVGRTTTPGSCNFAVWEGYGYPMAPPADGPTMKIPSRHHHLLRGALSDLGLAIERAAGLTPNLWWPDDRAWCVVSEIDFCWTYVAGSAELAAALEGHDNLETFEVSYDADHTVHGDTVNI